MSQRPVEAGAESSPSGWRLLWRPALLVVLLVALWLACRRVDLAKAVFAVRDFVGRMGVLAPLAFIVIRAGAAVALVPGSAVTALAGPLFGPVVGVVCVSAGKTLGAAAAFLIARYMARESVAAWLSHKGWMHRFDAFMAGRGGGDVVAMARLVPVIPFNVQNYAFGLTQVHFGAYIFCSWLFMLPSAVFVVTGTTILANALTLLVTKHSIREAALELARGTPLLATFICMIGALVAMIALAVWKYFVLRERIETYEPPEK